MENLEKIIVIEPDLQSFFGLVSATKKENTKTIKIYQFPSCKILYRYETTRPNHPHEYSILYNHKVGG